MKLGDKIVLVTGASSGIGLCTARALARAGARVVLAARRRHIVVDEAAALCAAGLRAMGVELDVTSDASVSAAVAEIVERWGGVDVVFNNAGNGGQLGLWANAPPEALRALFEVHVFGAERVTRALLPIFRAAGGGVIVNVVSTVAYVPMPAAAAYSSAKAAVVAFSEALRAELLGDHIAVLVFSPPHTHTAAGDAWPLGLPKVFEPEWVAASFVQGLIEERTRWLPGGNASLLMLQRLLPSLATRIMNGIGLAALDRLPTSPEQKRVGA